MLNLETVFGDSELVAPPKVRGNLGAVDDIFAGKASDVGTGAADILSLDDGDVLSLFGQRPSNVLGSFAAAQDYDVVLLRTRYFLVRTGERLGGTKILDAVHISSFVLGLELLYVKVTFSTCVSIARCPVCRDWPET